VRGSVAELPNAAELTRLAVLLAPGLVILGVRERFRAASQQPLKDRVIAFAVASAGYYAAVTPLFGVAWGVTLPMWLWNLLFYFLAPCAVAFAIVWIDGAEWFYKACARLHLRVAHHTPAAWDYAFSRQRKASYVWVKLNSGTEYRGVFGRDSFASTNAVERDLYIQEVWEMAADATWKKMEPERSVLLCGKDIRQIEFFR
jgi:MFS family permease